MGGCTHQVLSQSYKIQDYVLETYSTVLCLQLTIPACAFNTLLEDVPGGPVVKNPPADTGDPRSIPGLGTKIPHATGQLSPCSATTEPVLRSPGATTTEALRPQRPSSTAREATIMRTPHTATREVPTQQQRPRTARKKKKIKIDKISLKKIF